MLANLQQLCPKLMVKVIDYLGSAPYSGIINNVTVHKMCLLVIFLEYAVFLDLFDLIKCDSLKSCEPEFLVSTPERLLELLSIKAVDISGVSLLVIDGLEAPFRGAYFDAIKSIRQFIPEKLQTVVFCDCVNNSSISVVQKLSGGSFCK
ncbi:UNVERIFIED_CONTAM: hypothetical protein Slati_1184500 [Sesamum latifolium]|uniref:Uncharacterized protein n=1 Tax=Sesamum latifolium TaxID=2727402 RepID=A0AAW2XE65_9LAMI